MALGDLLYLNVVESSNLIDFDLIRSVASIFGIPDDKATNYIENVKVTVENNWKIIAKKHGLSRNEIEYMSPAFNMEYK